MSRAWDRVVFTPQSRIVTVTSSGSGRTSVQLRRALHVGVLTASSPPADRASREAPADSWHARHGVREAPQPAYATGSRSHATGRSSRPQTCAGDDATVARAGSGR